MAEFITPTNPLAEIKIRELEKELLRHDPTGAPIDASTLAIVTRQMNMTVRQHGLASKEIFMARNLINHDQIQFDDQELMTKISVARRAQHRAQTKHQLTRGRVDVATNDDFHVGALVMLRNDLNKNKA